MKMNKPIKLIASVLILSCFFILLTGCQKGKEFSSPENMIDEMAGVYAGSGEHSGIRIIIGKENVTKLNIDDVFQEIPDGNFWGENFPNEDWENFRLEALLSKPYVTVTTMPISADVRHSSISGLWIDKTGVLYSQMEDGYPLNKISSEASYPTSEMQEKFEAYRKYLKEYEIESLIAEAEDNYSSKKSSLDSTVSSAATDSASTGESTASAEMIANCAWEAFKENLKYPYTATLDSYSSTPSKDSYGRVLTKLVYTSQNGFGNYIKDDVYVLLQSCSSLGHYTYQKSFYFSEDGADFSIYTLKSFNDWDKDPNLDSKKESPYNGAIQLIKDGSFTLAISELEKLDGYRSSDKLITACKDYVDAEAYKKGMDLFAKGQYAAAIDALTAFLQNKADGYLRAERVITICNAAIRQSSDDKPLQSGEGTHPDNMGFSDAAWVDKYEELLHYAASNDEYGTGSYSLYDVDEDGTPELFLITGPTVSAMELTGYFHSPEAGYEPYFTLDVSQSSVCGIGEDNAFLVHFGHMGWENIQKITVIRNGHPAELDKTKIFAGEVRDYHDLTPLPSFALDDMSGLNWQENPQSDEAHNQAVIDSLPGQSSSGTNREEDAVRIFQTVTKSHWNGYTFADLEEIVFKDYDIQCAPYQGSNTRFLVTLSGNYCPNVVDLPNVQNYGKITLLVDTDTSEVSLIEDDGIDQAFEVYISLGTNWYSP